MPKSFPNSLPLSLNGLLLGLAITISILFLSAFSLNAFETSSWIFICSFLIFFIITAFFPLHALSLFLFFLPLSGNRPGTSQHTTLTLYCSTLLLGLFLNSLFSKKYSSKNELSNSIIFLLLSYTAISLLSLTSIPLIQILNEASSFISSSSPKILLHEVINGLFYFLHLRENTLGYSILTALLTLQCYAIAFFSYRLFLNNPNKTWLIPASILSGLVITLIFGITDYYKLIDLNFLRNLDPTANPKGIQYRLQSFFGHSGWFAEYLTLCIPFALIILTSSLRFSFKVFAIISILLIGEFALILSFQRGGWLSYPLTLFIVWSALYVSKQLREKKTTISSAFKSSAFKIIISIPITICLSLLALWYFNQQTPNSQHTAKRYGTSSYVQRFKDIERSSDRLEFFKAGFKLGSLHPILGAGSESFSFQFNKHFNQKDGLFYREQNLPLYGSAHNVYMQTFAGKGLVGLLLMLGLIFLTIFLAFRSLVNNHELSESKRIFALIGISFCFAFLIYGNVQEIFYINTLQVLFFTTLALTATVDTANFSITKKTQKSLISTIFACLCVHLIWEYVYPAPTKTDNSKITSYGCYDYEKDHLGWRFRWCGTRAVQEFQLNESKGKYKIRFAIEPISKDKSTKSTILITEPQSRRIIEKLVLPVGVVTQVALDVDKELLEEIKNTSIGTNTKKPSASLRFVTDHIVIPVSDYENSNDSRALSYKLYY